MTYMAQVFAWSAAVLAIGCYVLGYLIYRGSCGEALGGSVTCGLFAALFAFLSAMTANPPEPKTFDEKMRERVLHMCEMRTLCSPKDAAEAIAKLTPYNPPST